MNKIFKEYHKLSEAEIKAIWKEGIFVFDTNALLNMYRYSRDTVNSYTKVLKELKSKNKIWIPYQVGFEFYQNRINVINEYEQSYDSILKILSKTKDDISKKYKDHPFLDLDEIKNDIARGLSIAEGKINKAKNNHPKWIEDDNVLEMINNIFDSSVGSNYSKGDLDKLYKNAECRYKNKIPPGYKDLNKDGINKYGDYILWCQIIDKAKDTKKPIIFISGDLKEDWWLINNGKNIIPRPELKKEIKDEAGVDFHIYTADRFLEFYKSSAGTPVDEKAIKEVRKVRESEERQSLYWYKKNSTQQDNKYMTSHNLHPEFSLATECIIKLEDIMSKSSIDYKTIEDIQQIARSIKELNLLFINTDIGQHTFRRYVISLMEFLRITRKVINTNDLDYNIIMKIHTNSERLESVIDRLIKSEKWS